MNEEQLNEFKNGLVKVLEASGKYDAVEIVEGDILLSTPDADFALVVEPV